MNPYRRLFDLIANDEKNEKQITDIIDSWLPSLFPGEFSKMINTPHPCYTGAETMLMWAVWRLKTTVVKKLLENGAEVKFQNETGNSVSTYWNDLSIKNDEDAACEIAVMLHNYGTDLLRSSSPSWCIVRRARECGFLKLRATIEALDPEYKKYEFDDESATRLHKWIIKKR